ncbi:MAG: hypothetical protein C0409_10765 [Novosphingobium sp.]|nr:hypothetical protein [Novosphingobium sp.]
MSSQAGIEENKSEDDLNGADPSHFARKAMKRTFLQMCPYWRIRIAGVWHGVTHMKQDRNEPDMRR